MELITRWYVPVLGVGNRAWPLVGFRHTISSLGDDVGESKRKNTKRFSNWNNQPPDWKKTKTQRKSASSKYEAGLEGVELSNNGNFAEDRVQLVSPFWKLIS